MPSLRSMQKGFAKNVLGGGGLESQPGYQQGLSYLLQLLSGSPESRQAFEQPYLEQFEQQTIPGIAERFAGMGTGAGALSSSGLYNTLSQAGRGLQTDLASMYEQQRMNSLSQLLPFLQSPYNQKFQALQHQPMRRQRSSILGSLGGLAGAGLGFLSGGPAGSALGYGTGSRLG